MGAPKVSVVLPVYNGRATLGRAVRSVLDQSLPADEIEIIAVDDGSTDGSGDELERLASGHLRFEVVHQEASGGPGRPRNVGIERATGEYVFFLDADDHLAPEALERCCAMADANGTDVVIPKYVGVRRKVAQELFRENIEFTTVHDAEPNLALSISALKLFRREMLERHRIRFPEGVLSGEDQLFTVTAYMRARGVSILADYDSYFWVAREDGSSIMQQGGEPSARFFPQIEALMQVIADHTDPGPVRDRLLHRHFKIEVFQRFNRRFLTYSDGERRDTLRGARSLIRRWGDENLTASLPPHLRVIAHHLLNENDAAIEDLIRSRRGEGPPILIEDGEIYICYPGFRDPEAAIPDALFATTWLPGWTSLTALTWEAGRLAVQARSRVERLGPNDRAPELRLRHKDGAEHVLPLRSDGTGGLAAEIDCADLAAGLWTLHVVFWVGSTPRESRLRWADDAEKTTPGPRVVPVPDGPPYLTPHLAQESGALSLHAGSLDGHPVPVSEAEVSVTPSGHLHLATVLDTALPGKKDHPVTVRLLLRHRDTEATLAADASVEQTPGRLAVTAEIDLTNARRGKWDVSYEVTAARTAARFRTPAPATLDGQKGLRPFQTKKGNLSIEVTRVSAPTRLLRRLRRGRHQAPDPLEPR